MVNRAVSFRVFLNSVVQPPPCFAHVHSRVLATGKYSLHLTGCTKLEEKSSTEANQKFKDGWKSLPREHLSEWHIIWFFQNQEVSLSGEKID